MLVVVSIIALQLFRLSYIVFDCSTVMEVTLEQPENALSPMLVTLLGIVTEVKAVHSRNALSPMLVTPLGIVVLT